MQSDEDARIFQRAEVSVEALSPFYKARVEAALHE